MLTAVGESHLFQHAIHNGAMLVIVTILVMQVSYVMVCITIATKGCGFDWVFLQRKIGQSDWLVVHHPMKVELRYSITELGEQFVMISGIRMLLRLSAECLATLMPPMRGTNLILEEGMTQYGWMKCSALAMKAAYTNVPIATGVCIIVNTQKMLGQLASMVSEYSV